MAKFYTFTDLLGLLEIHKHSCCINSVFNKLMEIKDQHEEIKNIDQFHLVSVFINGADSKWKTLHNGEEDIIDREEIRVDFAYLNNGKINCVSLRDIYYSHDSGDFTETDLCNYQPFTTCEEELAEDLPQNCQLTGRGDFCTQKELTNFEVEKLFGLIKSYDISNKVANF
jgi:hypothetical protein